MFGSCVINPNASAKKDIDIDAFKSILIILIPNGFALVSNTANVCGKILSSTIKSFFLLWLKASYIASAAAVPSSNNEALATGNPVSSVISVW